MPPHTESDPGGSHAASGASGASGALNPKPQSRSPAEFYSSADEAREKQWEVAAKGQPFIGPLIPLESLAPEFIPGSNAYKKILYLCSHKQQEGKQEHQQHDRQEQQRPSLRRVRRDGCCFYRSYMFGVFEHIVGNTAEVQALKKRVQDILVPRMLSTGYKKEAIEEFVEEMQGALERLEEPSATLQDVEALLNEAGPSNYLVVFARLCAAAELRFDAASYLPFLSGHSSINTFCIKEVEPMWVGAEQPQILALSEALGFPVEIVYIDQSPGDQPARHVFPDSPKSSVRLLYRPGHYDLLYV